MLMDRSFPVAHLSKEKLTKIQKFEQKLREETGEDIVLIAYEHKTTK
ncbi:hypothetical protein ACFSCX_02950 [Bacillus salitolerans]|uniref:Uncharacterized protein n=1 Tax=Bacillus salitolerans TaxID=1437434 RepID=A0ABW4LKE8_9BACI